MQGRGCGSYGGRLPPQGETQRARSEGLRVLLLACEGCRFIWSGAHGLQGSPLALLGRQLSGIPLSIIAAHPSAALRAEGHAARAGMESKIPCCARPPPYVALPCSPHCRCCLPCAQAGMERKDVMSKNVAIYKAQAAALEKGAAPGCKVRAQRLGAAGVCGRGF